MNIILLRLSSIGDIVLTEPIIKQLKTHFPDSHLTFLTKKSYVDLLSSFSGIDQIIGWDGKISSIKSIDRKFDLVIDLHKKLNTFMISLFLKKKRIVRYDKKRKLRKQIIRKTTNDVIDSTLILYASIFENLNLSFKFSNPTIIPIDSSQKKINKLFIDYGVNPEGNILTIYPGASYNTKKYPVEYLSDLINMIPEEWHFQIIIHGGHQDKREAVEIKRRCKSKVVDMCGATAIAETIALISASSAIISNDSGPMHIAAALNKPQIAIFGATHTKLGFRPLNEKAIVLQSNICCQPCSLHGGTICPNGHFNCMRTITPELLLENLQHLTEKFIWGLDDD
ncbi:MAG: glycosyltransferase family 9 protein [Candidatus Cloacimonetes bacterium]|nr:glycosyltransferase family 9 protein [Candidatus Cloacimonadota bacterium]